MENSAILLCAQSCSRGKAKNKTARAADGKDGGSWDWLGSPVGGDNMKKKIF